MRPSVPRLPEDQDARTMHCPRQEERKSLKDARKEKSIERENARVEAQRRLSA